MGTPAIQYRTSVFPVKPTGKPRLKYPLPPKGCPILQAAYAFDQDLSVKSAGFPPAPLNTPSTAGASHATFGLNAFTPPGTIPGGGLPLVSSDNAILTGLSQPSEGNADLKRFTASFAIVPASWDEFVKQTITFPGIRDFNYTGGARDPIPVNALVRIRHDYFLVDPDGTVTGLGLLDSGGNAVKTVLSKGAIPSIYRTPWKFLVAGAILPGSEVTGLVKAGGITGWLETVPKTETYQSWVAVAAAFNAALLAGGTQAWDSSHPPLWNGGISPATTIGQYCFQDSGLSDFEGNIVDRTSFYVLAQ